jgi:hypothetical protein
MLKVTRSYSVARGVLGCDSDEERVSEGMLCIAQQCVDARHKGQRLPLVSTRYPDIDMVAAEEIAALTQDSTDRPWSATN